MNYLSVDNIGRNLGERWLFKNITFGILQGEKVALIGSNGSGKSSLMDILFGKVDPDGGIVSLRKDIRVGYLDQNPFFNSNQTVLETIFFSENEISTAIKNYEKSIETGDVDLMSKSIETLDTLQGWDYEAKVKQILGKLGIHDFEKLMGQLSGGQQKRVALARVLLEEPDFLLLDEPTNHLDLETIEWLEGYLSSANTTLFLVTHDRYFLDKVCNRIIELNNNQIHKYMGNYAYFLEKKAEREEMDAVTLEKNRQLLKKELEWMRRQPKARTTKAQYRIDAFHELKEKATGPKKEEKLELSMKAERLGGKIIEIQHISKSYNDTKFISEFSYTFKKGDKIGIVGKNGMGKSTLLKLITDQIKPDLGKIIKGDTIKIGYYSQDGLDFKEDQRIIDIVREIAEFVKMADGREMSISNFLTLFLFPPAMQYSFVNKLSGGEKRRLQLLKILVTNPNFLILDEPTNDLDISTLNVLEEFLQAYQGCLLVVSHDRYFMDRLVDHIFAFEGEGYIKDFPGNYTEYRNWKDELEETAKKNEGSEKSKPQEIKIEAKPEKPKVKLSYKELIEFESLEKDIAALEITKSNLVESLNQPSLSFDKITEISIEIEKINNSLETKELRWLELSEK